MNIKESHVTIMVSDMDRSIKFYETIGLKLKQRWDNHYAQMNGQGITIGIHPAGEPPTGSGSVSIGFITDDLKPVKEILSSNQIPFEAVEDKAGDFINFQDPDKTILYFMKMNW